MAGTSPGHARVFLLSGSQTWMSGTSPVHDDFLLGDPTALGHQKAIIQPLAAVSSMIGPNSSQRSPLNFIICNCLLTR